MNQSIVVEPVLSIATGSSTSFSSLAWSFMEAGNATRLGCWFECCRLNAKAHPARNVKPVYVVERFSKRSVIPLRIASRSLYPPRIEAEYAFCCATNAFTSGFWLHLLASDNRRLPQHPGRHL